jgi:hypothetical protein
VSLRRHLSREAIAHANADSPTHERHVEQRSRQRAIEWVPATVDTNAASEFRLQADGLNLEKGVYHVGVGCTERNVSGTEFESVCAAVNWQRRWNKAQMKRGDKVATVRRKRTHEACEEFVVNLSPWQMKFVNEQLSFWKTAGVTEVERKGLLLGLLENLRPELVARFQNVTGRDVIGSYVHLDSNKVHFGIVHSRVSANNELIGQKSIRTVGPWSTAQNRIVQMGLADAADHRLRENLEKFHCRHGGNVMPLDIELHERLDAKFDTLVTAMGKDAEHRFEAAKKYYGKWKQTNRRESVVRSSASATIAYETLRLLLPLLPSQVRAAVSIARTGLQAFNVVSGFLKAIKSDEAQPQLPTPKLQKTK